MIGWIFLLAFMSEIEPKSNGIVGVVKVKFSTKIYKCLNTTLAPTQFCGSDPFFSSIASNWKLFFCMSFKSLNFHMCTRTHTCTHLQTISKRNSILKKKLHKNNSEMEWSYKCFATNKNNDQVLNQIVFFLDIKYQNQK